MSATMTLPDSSTYTTIKAEQDVPTAQLNIQTTQETVPKRASSATEEPGRKRQRLIESSSGILGGEELDSIVSDVTFTVAQQLDTAAGIKEDTAGSSNGSVLFVAGEAQHHGRSFNANPQLYMRLLSLPILESLSTQIVSILAQGSTTDNLLIVTEHDTALGKAYATLKSLFVQTMKIYTDDTSYLSAEELSVHEPEHRAAIRLANLATFVSGIFEGAVDFYALNAHFVEILTPHGEPLEQVPGELFLDLKTQLYLSAMLEAGQVKTREIILDEFYPPGLGELLAGRHLESPLSSNELAFLDAARQRRELFEREPSDPENIQRLSEKFSWDAFLVNFCAYLNEAYGTEVEQYMDRHDLSAPVTPALPQESGIFRQDVAPEDVPAKSIEDDFSGQVALAVQIALQSHGYQDQCQPYSMPHNSAPFNTINNAGAGPQQQAYLPPATNDTQQSQTSGNGTPYQSAPTQVLYERARQAAAAKSNPTHARRSGSPSQRRPWSNDEENALMAGLDTVQGPHWSQILALYGRNGTISNILKDRNQVQLKDKARNLKLFFLKSGSEVPYFLQTVTGCLKTRAPTQAARKEAEARARLGDETSQARFNSIMTLANGFQSPGEVAAQADGQAPIQPGEEILRGSSQISNGTISSLGGPKIKPPEAQSEDNLMEQLLAAKAETNVVS